MLNATDLCPGWCTNGDACGGEHFDTKTYVLATGLPPEGASAPSEAARLGVGMERSDLAGDDATSVVLHVDGTVDVDVQMQPHEAAALVAALLERLQTLTGPARGTGRELRSHIDSPDARHGFVLLDESTLRCVDCAETLELPGPGLG
jgi:hypothetical protein